MPNNIPPRRPSLNSTIRSILAGRNLAPSEREKLTKRLKDLQGLGQSLNLSEEEIGRIIGRPNIPRESPIVVGRKITPKQFDAVIKIDSIPIKDRRNLGVITGRLAGEIQTKIPDVLPKTPLKSGEAVTQLPITLPILNTLLKAAGRSLLNGQETALWNDGLNSIVVYADSLSSEISGEICIINLTLECEETGKAIVQTPFAIGTEKKSLGLIMATREQPTGDARITQVWGGSVIAFSYGAFMLALQEFAGSLGRDENNNSYIPVATTLVKDALRITFGTRYETRYKDERLRP